MRVYPPGVSHAPGDMRINQSLTDINLVQTKIMSVVDKWSHSNNTPIPYKEIVRSMFEEAHVTETTVKAAIRGLVQRGYIRRAVTVTNRTYYVQLRSGRFQTL